MTMNGVRGLVMALLAASGCGSPPVASTTIAFDVTANPNPIAGAPCTGCGSASTDRWSVTALTLTETAGVAGNVASIAMTLRDGNNGVVAQGEFDGSNIVQLAGSNRLPARGALTVRDVGTHYAASFAGTPGTLTYVIRLTDDSGNQVAKQIVVPVSGM